MSGLRSDLRKAEGKKKPKVLIVISAFSIISGIAIGLFYWMLSGLPAVKALEEYIPIESSRIYSSDGKVIAELYLERRTFIPHYKIPEQIKKAFISVEDIRFYQHPGVDIIGILRAFYYDIRAGSVVQGGSTITQQLAKMLFLKPEKSVTRKIKEAMLSIQIERRYTKSEILGLYLNQTYFGTRAYGIEAAAETYFGKSVQELNLAEAALLASLPKAPSVYSPFRNPEKAKERRSRVLKEMQRHGFITRSEYETAEQVPLPITPNLRKYDAPYFIEMLRQNLEAKYGNALYTAGYKIYSTVDMSLQEAAEQAVTKGAASVEKRTRPGVEAALVAIDIRTGQVKAMVGGVDFWKNQFNRAASALRQPGSAFKPFVYVTAIQSGMTSRDMIEDTPIYFKSAKKGQMWSPKNYDGVYHGDVSLKTALAQSLNAATVRLADMVGINNVIDTAKKLGIKSELQPYMPLAIGASDVTLLEMTSAYTVFASGYLIKPALYEKILNRDNITIDETMTASQAVLSEDEVEELKILLRAVVEEGTAQNARELKRPVFGKTGTTNDYTDAWFVGFDDRLAVGVWVGRDDHKPMRRESGSKAALPIWIDFMKRAPLQTP